MISEHNGSSMLKFLTPYFFLCVVSPQAAFIGAGVMVVTNDEMRDHHFQMLSQRKFLRWKERHCVRFNFGPQTAEVGSLDDVLSPPSSPHNALLFVRIVFFFACCTCRMLRFSSAVYIGTLIYHVI